MTHAGKSLRRRLAEALPGRLRYAAIALWGYHQRTGRWPNLLHPHDIREKCQACKIWDHDSRLPRFADKLLVKDYVDDRLGPGWTVPTLWSGTALPPLADRNWPLPFVVKVNCGCGWNIFVRSEADRDWPVIEVQCRRWLATSFALDRGEWHYDRIAPRILIEPYICGSQDLPVDYKFWTFHGEVAFINVITNRGGDDGFRFTLFDRDWQRIPADMGFPTEPGEIHRPASLARMIAAAETLADDLPFVRVDFYEIGGQPVFGEMTFYPGAGLDPFNPPEFDHYVLNLWNGTQQPPLATIWQHH